MSSEDITANLRNVLEVKSVSGFRMLTLLSCVLH